MSRPIIAAVALVMVLGSTALSAGPLPPEGFEQFKGRNPAPETSFFDDHGLHKTVGAFRGKVVILNIWATWCPVCVEEIPSLERLATILPSEKFAVVAVSQDRGGSAIVRPFLERLGVRNLPLFVDPAGRLFRDLSVRGLPTTVIIAPDGSVVGMLEGSIKWDTEEVIAYLESLFRS